jgi:hypothetical protein
MPCLPLTSTKSASNVLLRLAISLLTHTIFEMQLRVGTCYDMLVSETIRSAYLRRGSYAWNR